MVNIDPILSENQPESLVDAMDILNNARDITYFIESFVILSVNNPDNRDCIPQIPATNGYFVCSGYSRDLVEKAKKIIKKHLETDGTLREGKEVNQ